MPSPHDVACRGVRPADHMDRRARSVGGGVDRDDRALIRVDDRAVGGDVEGRRPWRLLRSGEVAQYPQAGEIEGGRISQEEIILICDNLFVGGTENTRIAAAGGMHAFLEHPEQWRRVVADPGMLPVAVEEVLRWTSTTTHIARTAVRPAEIRGRRITAGDLVTMWIPSANRDEDVFADPDRFDVSRQPNRHLALGFGEHFCVGNKLARVEIRLLYQELINRSLTVVPDGEPKRLGSIVVNGLEHLPVKLEPTRSAAGMTQQAKIDG